MIRVVAVDELALSDRGGRSSGLVSLPQRADGDLAHPVGDVLPLAVNCGRPGHVGEIRFRRDGPVSVPVAEA